MSRNPKHPFLDFKAVKAHASRVHRDAAADAPTRRIERANPLKRGRSRATISFNIREMMRAGHPQRQAIAAALRQARSPRGRRSIRRRRTGARRR
jgi:hypothetical protein